MDGGESKPHALGGKAVDLALSPLGRGWPEGSVRGVRMAVRPAKAQPPHPDPLPRGERGL
ncbi:hypothetical protein GAY33_26115 [Azospirillum brasilense]|nr:hypothetical protein [Azospirillum argentinense]